MVKKKINEGLVKGKSKMTEILLVPNTESRMTEPLPIPVQQSTSISDPLQGYLDFVAMFKIIRMQHEDNGMDFKKLIPIYGFEADRMFGFNLNTHSYNALSAIRPLLLTQNNNSDRLIREIEKDFDSLRKWFDNVIEGSPVLKNSKELNDDELQLYFQRLSDEEKDEYRLYNRLARPFYDFYSSFLDLVEPRGGKNKIEKDANDIPVDHLEKIHKKLIEMKILDSNGVVKNKIDKTISSKPALNLAIDIIAKHFGIPTQKLQGIVSGSWSIKPKSNAYSSPSKNRLQGYKNFLNPLELWLNTLR
jgi:hypothetical protein